MLKADKIILERYLPSLNYAVSICEGSENADMHNFYLRELRDVMQREYEKLVAEAIAGGYTESSEPVPATVTRETLEKQLAEVWANAAEEGRVLNTVSFDHVMQGLPAGGYIRQLIGVDVSSSSAVNISVAV